MKTEQRDPRVEPRAGDTMVGNERPVRVVHGLYEGMVVYSLMIEGVKYPSRICSLAEWRRWAKKSKALQVKCGIE